MCVPDELFIASITFHLSFSPAFRADALIKAWPLPLHTATEHFIGSILGVLNLGAGKNPLGLMLSSPVKYRFKWKQIYPYGRLTITLSAE